MSCKHVMWFISIVVAVVAMAAGVAVLVHRFILDKKEDDDYEFIECDGDNASGECEKKEEKNDSSDDQGAVEES